MSSNRENMIKTAITVRERMRAYHLPAALKMRNEDGLAELKSQGGLELMASGRLWEGARLYTSGLRASRRPLLPILQLLLFLPGFPALLRLGSRLRKRYGAQGD
jgi:hypothetical protein